MNRVLRRRKYCPDHKLQGRIDNVIPAEERFWAKVNKDQNCWLWLRALTDDGYGVFNNGKKSTSAHIFSYELENGPVPIGHEVNHMCHNKSCVRPSHLTATDKNDNGAYRKGATVLSKTGVRGVFWLAAKQRWGGRLRYRDKDYSTGLKLTLDEAEQSIIAIRESILGVADYNPADWQPSLTSET